jgi:hypothetical protein
VTRRLMTHPGVGPLTALAFELVIGTPERFPCGKQMGYVGLVIFRQLRQHQQMLGRGNKKMDRRVIRLVLQFQTGFQAVWRY